MERSREIQPFAPHQDYSTLFTKNERYNMNSMVALLKVESSFYLQEAAPNGETSLGNVWWLYRLVPTSCVGSNVDVSRLSRL